VNDLNKALDYLRQYIKIKGEEGSAFAIYVRMDESGFILKNAGAVENFVENDDILTKFKSVTDMVISANHYKIDAEEKVKSPIIAEIREKMCRYNISKDEL
jgi:hypothetical protein